MISLCRNTGKNREQGQHGEIPISAFEDDDEEVNAEADDHVDVAALNGQRESTWIPGEYAEDEDDEDAAKAGITTPKL